MQVDSQGRGLEHYARDSWRMSELEKVELAVPVQAPAEEGRVGCTCPDPCRRRWSWLYLFRPLQEKVELAVPVQSPAGEGRVDCTCSDPCRRR